MPDLTDERAARWWTEKRRYLVEEVGVDGFKTDGGEHAWGRDLVYLDGTRGDEGNNRFPVAYAAGVRRPAALARARRPSPSAAPGSPDPGARRVLGRRRELDLGGVPLVDDRRALGRGHAASSTGAGTSPASPATIPTAELYLRAMAASAFVPIMQYHSEFNHHRTPSSDRTPWNIAERTGDDAGAPVSRKFVTPPRAARALPRGAGATHRSRRARR